MNDYIFSNEFYKNVDLMVSTCGLERCKPAHSYGPAVRSSWMIHYIQSGKGIYQCRGKTFSLQAGDFFLMIPGERIYYEADKDDPWTYCWIGLQGAKTREYMERTSLPEKLMEHVDENSRLSEVFKELEAIEYEANEDLHLNAIAYFLLYELALAYPATALLAAPSAAQYTDQILSYVEQNFDQDLSISGIAAHFSLDRTYIHKLVKSAIGMSLQEYIISLRLANACSYLMFTDLSISDIARSVGCKDSLAFSRLFRKRKGMSPSAYREQKRRPDQQDASMNQMENTGETDASDQSSALSPRTAE